MVRGRARNIRGSINRGSIFYVPVAPSTFKRQHAYPSDMQIVYGNRGRQQYDRKLIGGRAAFSEILSAPGGYYMYQPAFSGQLRRRQPIALDRRRRTAFLGGRTQRRTHFPLSSGGFKQRRAPFMNRRERGGFRRRLNVRRGRTPASRSALDAQLDAYMGDNATKMRLDSQLDIYFGRSSGQQSAGESDMHHGKSEPMSDPNDLNMAAPLVRQ